MLHLVLLTPIMVVMPMVLIRPDGLIMGAVRRVRPHHHGILNMPMTMLRRAQFHADHLDVFAAPGHGNVLQARRVRGRRWRRGRGQVGHARVLQNDGRAA